MAKLPDPVRNRSTVIAGFSLAGDDQNQTMPDGPRVQHEMDQLRMGLGKRHAMQVDPRLGNQFATPHSGMDCGVHAQRRVCDAV